MKEDRRILKTKEALVNACGHLLITHSIDTITVKELCEEANLNRSTFYTYYSDINQFLESLHDTITQEIALIIKTHHHPKIAMTQNRKLVLSLFEYFETKRYFMQAILCRSYLRKTLIDQFRYTLEEQHVFDYYQNNQFLLHYIAYGFIGIVIHWLNDSTASPQEMCEIALHFFNAQYTKKDT